jgi:AAA family ATP:ADP antiporter
MSERISATDLDNDGGAWHALFRVRREERRALLLAFAYFFCVLGSYYILRPIRDELGVASGVDKLPWLFTGTLGLTLLISPLFSALVAKLPRDRFVTWSYRGLMLCLAVFFLLFRETPESWHVWVGRVFFVWLSAYTVFSVSLFWAVMADSFRTEQARRLYGIIGAGGTLGGLAGGLVTGHLAEAIGTYPLLLIAAALLEVGLRCMRGLSTTRLRVDSRHERRDEVIGGSIWGGLNGVLRSPYLLGVCAFMLLFALGSTFLYFLQAQIVDLSIADRAARTAYFASVDVWVNGLTLLIQLGLTGRILARIGVGWTLALVPILSMLGFLLLGMTPLLSVVIVFQVLRRTFNFALTGPAREVLYVPLSREEKYKAKNLIDTFVFRFGDQMGAWTHTGLVALGLGIGGIALAAVPLSALWLLLALWLGRRHAQMRPTPLPADIALTQMQ